MIEKEKRFSALKRFLSPIGTEASFSLEMRSRGGSLVGGVVGISELTEDRIGLCLAGGEKLVFSGSGLYCVSFGCRCIEISGKIMEMRFE